tara:strand:- start:43 stop:297 length:255 start_codon:yes stop_codon:yes gene_type:complete
LSAELGRLPFEQLCLVLQAGDLLTEFAGDAPEGMDELIFLSVAQATEVGQAFHENLIGKARQNLRIFFTMPLQGNLNSYDLFYY